MLLQQGRPSTSWAASASAARNSRVVILLFYLALERPHLDVVSSLQLPAKAKSCHSRERPVKDHQDGTHSI